MGKLFRIYDYILLIAATASEIGEEMRLVGDIVPWVYKTKYGFVPQKFKKQSYVSIVSRMLSTDLINRKIDKNGEPYLELSSSGRNEFKRRFPIFATQRDKWDGFFMQVIFDIPEKQRKNRFVLRSKLKELGFGMIQKSVFITPYHFENDLKEFLGIQGLTEDVYVMDVKGILVGDLKILAKKVWKIDKINERYKDILDKAKKGIISDKQIDEEYFKVLEDDPYLPKEFLPNDWAREEVAKLVT